MFNSQGTRKHEFKADKRREFDYNQQTYSCNPCLDHKHTSLDKGIASMPVINHLKISKLVDSNNHVVTSKQKKYNITMLLDELVASLGVTVPNELPIKERKPRSQFVKYGALEDEAYTINDCKHLSKSYNIKLNTKRKGSGNDIEYQENGARSFFDKHEGTSDGSNILTNNDSKVESKDMGVIDTKVVSEENTLRQFDSFKTNCTRMDYEFDRQLWYTQNHLLINKSHEGENRRTETTSYLCEEQNSTVKLKDSWHNVSTAIWQTNNNDLLKITDLLDGSAQNTQSSIISGENREKTRKCLKFIRHNLVVDMRNKEQNDGNISHVNDSSSSSCKTECSNNAESNMIVWASKKQDNKEGKCEKIEISTSDHGCKPRSFKTLNLEMESLNSYLFTDSLSKSEVFHDETANQGPNYGSSDSESQQHLCHSCCKLLSLHTFEEHCKCIGKIEVTRSSSNSIITTSSGTPKSKKTKKASRRKIPRKNTSVSAGELTSPESTTGSDVHTLTQASHASFSTPVNCSLSNSKEKAKKKTKGKVAKNHTDVTKKLEGLSQAQLPETKFSGTKESNAVLVNNKVNSNVNDISAISPVPGPSGLDTQDYIALLQNELLSKEKKSLFKSSKSPSKETNKDIDKSQSTGLDKKRRKKLLKRENIQRRKNSSSATWKIKLKQTVTNEMIEPITKQEKTSPEKKEGSDMNKSDKVKPSKVSKRKSTVLENVDKLVSPTKSYDSSDSVFKEINSLCSQGKSLVSESDKQSTINLQQTENGDSHIISKFESTNQKKSPLNKKAGLDKLLHEMIFKELSMRIGDNLDISTDEGWKNKHIPSSTLNGESDTEAIFKEINCIDTSEYHKTLSHNTMPSEKTQKQDKLLKSPVCTSSGKRSHSEDSSATGENSKVCSGKAKKRKRPSSTCDDIVNGENSVEGSVTNKTYASKVKNSKKSSSSREEHNSSIICEKMEIPSESKKSKKRKQSKQYLSSEGTLSTEIENCENNQTGTLDFSNSKSFNETSLHRLSSCSESSYLQDDSEISLEVTKRLKFINIVVPWEIPPLHMGDDRIGTLTSKAVQMEKQAMGIPIKKGIFTKAEDDLIKENFTMFCNLHDLPHDPKPFMNFKQPTGFIMSKDERVKFAQFIGHGLTNRFLNTIYKRFCRIHWNQVASAGKFTPEEDGIILAYLKITNSNSPFLDLAKKLNRSRRSVYLRYKVLTRHNQETIKWTPDLMEQFLNKLLDISQVEKISVFKKREVTAEEFREISRTMDIPVFKLRQAWKATIYPKIFGESISDNLSVMQVKLSLIDTLFETKADDWRQVDFSEIAKNYKGITGRVLYTFLKTMISQKVPQKYHNNFRRCIKYLEKHKEMIVNSRKRTIPVFKFENGRLIRR